MSATSNSSSWGRLLAIVVLAVAVSAAPRAADLCDALCAGAPPQGHIVATPDHCAQHAAGGRVVASAHGCQMHAHPVHVAATDVGVTSMGSTESGSAVQARLSAPLPVTPAMALFLPAAPPPRLASRAGDLSPHPSRSRPLAFALALRI